MSADEVVLSTQSILIDDELIEKIVEDEVAVDEDTDDNDNLEEEHENTKPRASVIRDAIDILANYSMYVDNIEIRTLNLKLSKIVEATMQENSKQLEITDFFKTK